MIYLDYAATTPVDPEVLKAMAPYFSRDFGNPGSLHEFGQKALAAIDESRAAIASFLNAESGEIIFTGSATEANNLAIRGVIKGYGVRDKGYVPHIVTTAIEHESVLETCRDLEKLGEAEVTYIGVSREGFVNLEEVKKALRPETVLVSVMYANNEIGTIQPIREISEIVRGFRPNSLFSNLYFPVLHTDAAQAVQFLDCDVQKLGVDLMTISAHKIYGPKGVGALYARTNVSGQLLSPIITGGGQEHGLRSGTENVPYIVGFAKAMELARVNREKTSFKFKTLREELWNGIMRFVPSAKRNTPEQSLPNILNVSFLGKSGEELLFQLDRAGIAVSTGSACKARSTKPSGVLVAMGLDETLISSAIRFSLGRPTTAVEIKKALGILKEILK